jgi:hypothetical protein
LRSGMKHQRCVWHGKRDFPYLLYADGVKKGKQVPWVEKLKSIPALQFTRDQLEALRPEDQPLMEKIFQQTKQGFAELVEALDRKKYPKALLYIQNLMKPVTTFLSRWLQRGEVIPLNTNAIECAFRQVCNRIKRVGRRWSQQGLLRWLKVAFYKLFKSDLWNLQWRGNRKRLPKIKLTSLQISYFWSRLSTEPWNNV